MPQNGDHETDRRTVLKSLTAGAVGAATFSSLASAASPNDGGVTPTAAGDRVEPDRVVESLDDVGTAYHCETEYKCADTCYKDGSYEQAYKRDCCHWNGEWYCENWERIDRCCF